MKTQLMETNKQKVYRWKVKIFKAPDRPRGRGISVLCPYCEVPLYGMLPKGRVFHKINCTMRPNSEVDELNEQLDNAYVDDFTREIFEEPIENKS